MFAKVFFINFLLSNATPNDCRAGAERQVAHRLISKVFDHVNFILSGELFQSMLLGLEHSKQRMGGPGTDGRHQNRSNPKKYNSLLHLSCFMNSKMLAGLHE